MVSAFGSLYDEIEKQRLAAGGAAAGAPAPDISQQQAAAGATPAQIAAYQRMQAGGTPTPATDGSYDPEIIERLRKQTMANGGSGVAPTSASGVAGVSTGVSSVNSGGIPGMFGDTDLMNTYTSNQVNNPRYDANQSALANEIARARGGQNVGFNTAQADQARAQQMGLVGILQQQAMGQGPSAATSMLQDANERSFGQAISLAKSGNGVNPAAAFDTAQRVAADASQGNARTAAGIRAGEQMAAQQGLSGLLAGMRGQDLGTAQATNSSAVQQNAMRDALIQQYMQLGMSADEANFRAQVQQQQFNADLLARQEATGKGISMQGSAQAMQLGGALASAGGGLFGTLASKTIGEAAK